MITNEAYVISTKDILYNKSKFDSGEINICFITGLSGSGKSTMAKNSEAEIYELDDLVQQWRFTDENLKEYGDLIYSFFKTIGKKWRGTEDEINKKWHNTDDEYEKTLTEAFIKYAINYAKSHKNIKFIIEGVWLFHYIKPETLKDYAVYIKGTSALKSRHRGAWRDSSDAETKTDRIKAYLKIMTSKNNKYYYANEKKVQQWRDYFSKLMKDDKVIESMSIHISGNEVKFVQKAESELISEATILYEQCEANEIGLLALDEGLREVLEEYITKIREGMNKAFDKLKQIIEEKQNKVLKLILEQVQNDPKDPDFTIDNYCTYDTNKLLNSYRILPLEYDVMKDDLIESKQNFLQKYYPNCYDPELSIKEKIMKDVKSQPRDTRCTNEMLVNMINFCLEGYKPIYDQIEQDKELISKSCDAIKAVADSIDTTVQQTGGADVRQATGESALFFLEADEKQDKLGFKDDPNAKAKNASPAKVVSTWCSVVTSIYSAKMKVLNTMRSDYYRILVHHARLRGWSLVPPKK